MPPPDNRLDIMGEKYLRSRPVPGDDARGKYEIADDDVEGFLVEQRVQPAPHLRLAILRDAVRFRRKQLKKVVAQLGRAPRLRKREWDTDNPVKLVLQ